MTELKEKKRKKVNHKIRKERLQRLKEERLPRAIARYLRVAPRKARLVIDAIRGKSVKDAEAILSFSNKRVASMIMKTLKAAIASAINEHDMDEENLYIHRAYVDNGPIIKRWRARAMGRATPIKKRTSHITIILASKM